MWWPCYKRRHVGMTQGSLSVACASLNAKFLQHSAEKQTRYNSKNVQTAIIESSVGQLYLWRRMKLSDHRHSIANYCFDEDVHCFSRAEEKFLLDQKIRCFLCSLNCAHKYARTFMCRIEQFEVSIPHTVFLTAAARKSRFAVRFGTFIFSRYLSFLSSLLCTRYMHACRYLYLFMYVCREVYRYMLCAQNKHRKVKCAICLHALKRRKKFWNA